MSSGLFRPRIILEKFGVLSLDALAILPGVGEVAFGRCQFRVPKVRLNLTRCRTVDQHLECGIGLAKIMEDVFPAFGPTEPIAAGLGAPLQTIDVVRKILVGCSYAGWENQFLVLGCAR